MERAGLECERARCNKCMRITIAFNKGTFFQFLDHGRVLSLGNKNLDHTNIGHEKKFENIWLQRWEKNVLFEWDFGLKFSECGTKITYRSCLAPCRPLANARPRHPTPHSPPSGLMSSNTSEASIASQEGWWVDMGW